MADLARTTVWKGADWNGRGLSFAERPHSGKLLLRGDIDGDVARKLEAILGCALPERVGPLAGDHPAVGMLAPGRWLILANAERAASCCAKLAAVLEGGHAVVTDVSDGLIEIAIEGPRAAKLLASATSMDLRMTGFPIASLAQTQFARTACTIRRRAEHQFNVFVDASYASYVLEWLRRTAPLVEAID